MEERKAKPRLFVGLFRGALRPCARSQRESREGDGLKDLKSSCRVVSSGSFTAFRMTARPCKIKGKSLWADGESTLPPIAKCAMDGAPGRLWQGRENDNTGR